LESASADTTIKIWDIKSGNLLKNLNDNTNWVTSLAVIPENKLASASFQTIIIWE
jgi:WD40 repeat protein